LPASRLDVTMPYPFRTLPRHLPTSAHFFDEYKQKAMNNWIKNGIGLAAIAAVTVGTGWAVRHYHRPGQLDVLTAQAMDMSQMRPPTGAAPVALASVRLGSLADTVTYTGTVAAYNEQDISPRITGTLVSLPVYPGDVVRAGQLVARLDTAEVGAKTDQARQEARQAHLRAQVAQTTHSLRSRAALEQASAQVAATQQGVSDAQSTAQADQDTITDAKAGVQSAQANADYWKVEITREKQLADAGAVSQQEYQNEHAQAQAAVAAMSQAQAKVSQARALAQSARDKVQVARRQVTAAQAGVQIAQADLAVSQGQAAQAEAGASAADAAARTAAVQQGYSQIIAPFAGVVTARPVAPGTLVQPGTVLLKVAEIDRVRVQASIAVEDMAGVRVGSPVRITGQDDGKTIAARVTAVFPSASDQTRTATVEAVVPNPGHRLLPGAFVTMQITSGRVTDKMLVPASAVVSQNGSSSVWTATGGAAASGVGQVYECVICHIHYTAAQAKKFHYHDPMEGGKLVPLKGGQAALPTTGLRGHQVSVQVGASDGAWTEVSADALSAGTQVVTHGQAGLTDGTPVVAAAWGADGPKTLPTAAAATDGQTVYRCEKCGMTFSEEDAKRHNFVDPMDGGKLVPVPPAPKPSDSMPGMKM